MPSAAYLKWSHAAADGLDDTRTASSGGFTHSSAATYCWDEQHVVIWSSQFTSPKVHSATTAMPLTAGFVFSGLDSLNIQQQHTSVRRSRSDSGVGVGRPVSPGRIIPVPTQPPHLTVCCSSPQVQRNRCRHGSHPSQKGRCRGSRGGSCHISSPTIDVNLAVDCTAVIDVADCSNPAFYTSSEAAREQRAGCPVTAVADSSHGSTAAALKQRVQQLERRNRALERKLKQLRPGTEHPAQQAHLLPSTTLHERPLQQTDCSDQTSGQQLQACKLPGASNTQGQPDPITQQQQQQRQKQSAQQQLEHNDDVAMDSVPHQGPEPDDGSQQLLLQQYADSTQAAGAVLDPCIVGVTSVQELLAPSTPQPAEGISTTRNGSDTAICTLPADVQLCHQIEQRYQGTIMSLQQQVCQLQMLQGLLRTDNADLERALRETERQRRDCAARYAFVVLDHDNDGYISISQVLGYELFASYAPEVLQTAFNHWHWQSCFPGYLNIEDFVRFVETTQDRSSRNAQRFWFTVIDADGDGRVSWQDMKQMYDAIDKSAAAFVVCFQDLMNQIRDMVEQQQRPDLGFTFSELWRSGLGAGVVALLTNHDNMLLQRSTAEWGRGDFRL